MFGGELSDGVEVEVPLLVVFKSLCASPLQGTGALDRPVAGCLGDVVAVEDGADEPPGWIGLGLGTLGEALKVSEAQPVEVAVELGGGVPSECLLDEVDSSGSSGVGVGVRLLLLFNC